MPATPIRDVRRWALLAALPLGLALAPSEVAAGPGDRVVAPAGPCAEAEGRRPCPGGACTARTPARSRFDPTDVAGAAGGGAAAPLPGAEGFGGPGSCADPSTPCGGSEPTRLADRIRPPPAAPSPAGPPGSAPPPPPALPPAPPAPLPPGVIEQPPGPGTLPGLP